MGFLQSLRSITENAVVLFMIRPLTIIRMMAWTMSLIVAGSLVSGGYQNTPHTSELHCIFNDNYRACCFGIAMGLLGFMWCCIFLALDASEIFIQPKFQRCFMLTDLIISFIWTILWFVGFCFMANQWAMTSSHKYLLAGDPARTSITFSFFSIPCWAIMVYLTGTRIRSASTRKCNHSFSDGIETNLGKLTPASSLEFHSTPNGIAASYQINPALGGINGAAKY